MLIVVATLLACGASVDESEPALDLVEVCGAEGPVRLLDVEAPTSAVGGAYWGTTVLGERRLAIWYNQFAIEEGPFQAYLLDACGGNETRLGADEFPLVVGDAAYVCDPQTGDVRRLDVATGDTTEPLGSGYDCNPGWRSHGRLFLRNWDEDTWGLLTDEGLELLPVPLAPNARLLFPPAGAPYLSRLGTLSTTEEFVERPVFGQRLPDALVMYDIETRTVAEYSSDIEAVVGAEDGQDMMLVESADDDGSSATQLLARVGATPEPGPRIDGAVAVFDPVKTVSAYWSSGELVIPNSDERFLVPEVVDRSHYIRRLSDDLFWQGDVDRMVVWNGDSGAIELEVEPETRLCGSESFHEPTRTVLATLGADDECSTHALWAFPLDGSAPYHVRDFGFDQGLSLLPNDSVQVLQYPSGHSTGDLQLIDLDRDPPQVLARGVDGLAVSRSLALPRPLRSPRSPLEYYVRTGADAGLWLVGLPR